MEKSLEVQNIKVTNNTTESNSNKETKKTFHITQDVIEECLETFLG
ncbi:hypothetical protein [Clostridium brassicae]|uniref:Uncharacterized protein n=1 Tax=Clostridium brassicae TaxID=2999072 RepID=A0ABT4DDW4_9CLOT|nr:hypothetical protein [Clostridium brassicae]MCY6960510.1 hypothetical protein [Clostridium brassicae]